jgi:RNA polymerase sigma-70 factor (ECF subfamily)
MSIRTDFEAHRPRLRAVAYRMLGSLHDADDAVQETWLRAAAADTAEVANPAGWLTTALARECLHVLRARRRTPARAAVVPPDPEAEAVMADSVGLALLVVLDRLSPAERVAFVLHDIFEVPFEEIAAVLERSPAAARQLASRARRRVHAPARLPAADLTRQRQAVKAFLAASRAGDFAALLALLAPDIVVEAGAIRANGAQTVAEQALLFSHLTPYARPALIDGAPGLIVAPRGRLSTALTFAVPDARIARIDVISDASRLRLLDVGLDSN